MGFTVDDSIINRTNTLLVTDTATVNAQLMACNAEQTHDSIFDRFFRHISQKYATNERRCAENKLPLERDEIVTSIRLCFHPASSPSTVQREWAWTGNLRCCFTLSGFVVFKIHCSGFINTNNTFKYWLYDQYERFFHLKWYLSRHFCGAAADGTSSFCGISCFMFSFACFFFRLLQLKNVCNRWYWNSVL